jgi:site-specific DNA recombinase
MTQTAAIYTRISKDRDNNAEGVARQEKLAKELAERRGFSKVVIFTENDVSASTRSTKPRPKYAEMMSRALSGEFGAIVAYSYSRLTRRPQEFNDLIDLAERQGVKIMTIASGEFDLNLASGRAVARTVAAWDAAEAEQTSERIKAQKKQRAENGEWHGGAAPYGYRASDKKLTVEPAEAENVAEAVRRILVGDTLHSIVAEWNLQGRPTRTGKHWRQSNLCSILMNVSLLGVTKSGVTGWEPIIERSDFDRLQGVFANPSRKSTHSPGVRGGKYSMGGGLTVCAVCGKRLITHTRSVPGGENRVVLACLKRVNGPDAKHPTNPKTGRDTLRVSVDHARLERYVLEAVTHGLQANPRLALGLGERDPESEKKVRQLKSQRDGLNEQRSRAGDAYVRGLLQESDFDAHTVRIRIELETIQDQLNALLSRPLLAEAIADGLDWESWTPMRRRNFLKIAVKRVEVGPWPEGAAHNLPPRAGESELEWESRRNRHQTVVLGQRVNIVLT